MMKPTTLFFLVFALSFLLACDNPAAEQNPVFNRNMASMKAMFDGFQNKTIDPSLFADDFVDVGTGFEEENRNKEEAMQQWKMMTRVMDAELLNAVYLPGIDTTTFALDGSVRYYGQWKMTMGDASQTLKAYGSMEFNDVGEIATFAHYADWTATFRALLAENPEIAAKLNQRAARSEQ
tara:strand:- start:316 stop:852 length:537 start_codon:yes stop_codon:yes gene_type:complete